MFEIMVDGVWKVLYEAKSEAVFQPSQKIGGISLTLEQSDALNLAVYHYRKAAERRRRLAKDPSPGGTRQRVLQRLKSKKKKLEDIRLDFEDGLDKTKRRKYGYSGNADGQDTDGQWLRVCPDKKRYVAAPPPGRGDYAALVLLDDAQMIADGRGKDKNDKKVLAGIVQEIIDGKIKYEPDPPDKLSDRRLKHLIDHVLADFLRRLTDVWTEAAGDIPRHTPIPPRGKRRKPCFQDFVNEVAKVGKLGAPADYAVRVAINTARNADEDNEAAEKILAAYRSKI